MRQYITRTLVSSKISGFKLVLENGQPKTEAVEPVVIAGKVTPEKALKALKHVHGDIALTVSGIEETESTYRITVADFLRHAEKIEKEETENAEEI